MERIICLIIGYAFGLIQTSYFLGKLYNKDIRNYGSGSAGATNTMRTLGKKAGVFVLICDCLKCVIAIAVVRLIYSGRCADIMPLLSTYTAAGVVLGHNFPFYLQFKGGKGVAASLGFLLALYWPFGLLAFAICAVCVLLTGYVSLGSLSAYVVSLIAIIIRGQMGGFGMDQGHRIEMYVVVALLTVLAFWQHRENIKRLMDGTENKIFKK